MIQLCHFQWSCSLTSAEVNLKHGSEIPIEVCTAIFASGGNNAWWILVVGDWLHGLYSGPKCVLPTGLMILIQFPSGLVGIIRSPLPTSQTSTKQSGLGFLFQERPDEELCSLKVDGVSHRVAAPGIGVWMLGSVESALLILLDIASHLQSRHDSKICEFCHRCIPRPCEGCVTASITCQGTQPLM